MVRPPYAGIDGGDFVGTSLLDVDESSVRDIPGLVAVVRIADFVGGLGVLVVNTVVEKPTESLIGLLIVALGLPAYLYWNAKRRSH